MATSVLGPARGGAADLRLGRLFLLAAVISLVEPAASGRATLVLIQHKQSPAATVEELVGSRLVVGVEGTSPTPALLGRIRSGRVGGVILMGHNVRSAPQVRELTAALRAAARFAGRRILIVTDQEGGRVRRFRWAPPAASAVELGRLGDAAVRRRGHDTGTALDRLGIDVDLAPVADVPRDGRSFIAIQNRGFSTNPTRVAKRVTAFAAGLLDAGIAPTLKHFPGLGLAQRTTDRVAVTLTATREALAPDLIPYRRALAAGVVPLVMLSNASYTAYGGTPAPWSPSVLAALRALGFRGVTITDALEPLATTRGMSVDEAAIRAAETGVDLLLFVGSERSTARVYDALLAAAREGRLPRRGLERSTARIDELVATYSG